jgi:hypothetical protein
LPGVIEIGADLGKIVEYVTYRPDVALGRLLPELHQTDLIRVKFAWPLRRADGSACTKNLVDQQLLVPALPRLPVRISGLALPEAGTDGRLVVADSVGLIVIRDSSARAASLPRPLVSHALAGACARGRGVCPVPGEGRESGCGAPTPDVLQFRMRLYDHGFSGLTRLRQLRPRL